MSLADRYDDAAAAEEPEARWPPCSRCTVREAKPGVWCPHQLAATRCPWVLDASGRIAEP